MIYQNKLTADQIQFLGHELVSEAKGLVLQDCLASDLSRFILVLKDKYKEKNLFFCFQKPFLRFHFITGGKFKINSDLTHPLSALLKGLTFINAEAIPHDRVIYFHFNGRTLICEFFPKHPNFYVVDHANTILFSLHPIHKQVYTPPPARSIARTDASGPLLSHKEMEAFYNTIEASFAFENDKLEVKQYLDHKLKSTLKQINRVKRELDECMRWETIQHEGELLKAHFSSMKKGLSSISVTDWINHNQIVIALDPSKSPQEQVADKFKKSKKLHKGIPYLKDQLEKYEEAAKTLDRGLNELASITSSQDLEPFKVKWVEKKPQKASKREIEIRKKLPYYEYISASGIKIWVGKNAKANEKLTFTLASGSDWWLHVNGMPGSHIVVKVPKKSEPDAETLQDALQLALNYSKAKNQGEGEVLVTQRKYVTRLGKGQTGKVQVSKHELKWIRLDPQRFQSLKERRSRE